MKLETRLEKLEHEFKILKNEIQVTLLELQEQLLNRHYPALRAGDDDEPEYMPGYAPVRWANVHRLT
jgi:hypothetical protein